MSNTPFFHLPSDLHAFIQAEMARRCLSSERECLEAIVREARERRNTPDDSVSAATTAVFGDRSRLSAVLAERVASKDRAVPVTANHWDAKKRRLAKRHGLGPRD